MTYEEIQAERTRDYACLGRFLGLADRATAMRYAWGDKHFVDSMIEILRNYQAETSFPVPTATEGSKAKEVKGDADCRPTGMEGSRF